MSVDAAIAPVAIAPVAIAPVVTAPPGDREPPIDIRVLGPLSVAIGGTVVPLRSARREKFLALLATQHGSVVSLSRIVDVLWDDPPRSAHQQVYNLASALRRFLAGGAATLETVGFGYRLSVPDECVDLARFRSLVNASLGVEASGAIAAAAELLERALGEWSGPALSGLQGPHLEAAATSLAESRLEVVERLAALRLREGRVSGIVGPLRELVAEFPFRETLRAALMRVLHANGRQADALACFEEGRVVLADELGLDPGPILRAAHQDVLGGTNARVGTNARIDPAEPETPGTRVEERQPAPTAGVRSYLPRDIPEFTGRGVEIAAIADLLEGSRGAHRQALPVAAITGMGGVGKTTLAVHLAHRLADRFPGGHYFIDLRAFGTTGAALTPAAALAVLLRQSGVPHHLVPADAEERSALWRARTAGRRSLILLDNALNEAQVRALLPGSPDSLVLLTGRCRMPALQGSIPVPLDVLPEEESVELFRRIAGQRRTNMDLAAVAAVVGQCGRLPLAIQLAAAWLRDRTGRTAAQLAQQLADERARERVLVAGDRDTWDTLAWSYRRLGSGQQRLFRLLAIHPGSDIDAHLAGAIMDCPADEAGHLLEELLDANLLHQTVSGRYRLHRLLRECSRRLMEQHGTAQEAADARDRLLDHHRRPAEPEHHRSAEPEHLVPGQGHRPGNAERTDQTARAARRRAATATMSARARYCDLQYRLASGSRTTA